MASTKQILRVFRKLESKYPGVTQDAKKVLKEVQTAMPKKDLTPDMLCELFALEKTYTLGLLRARDAYNIPIRLNGLPSHVSENIIKFVVINKLGDKTCTWSCSVGDLASKDGKLECKCFTSDGPISFGPDQEWTHIYFLDARRWLEDTFVVWRVERPNTDDLWKTIKMNKKESKQDQSDSKRRPRINWEGLYPQIKEVCHKVWEGSFENIFIPSAEAPVALQ